MTSAAMDVQLAFAARNVRSEPDPPRAGLEDADIQCDLLVDTRDQGWFLLEAMNLVELMRQLEIWLSSEELSEEFAYRSMDAEDHARLLWFRPWHNGWAVGSPWAETGPFLVEQEDLVTACRRFLDESNEAIASRWPPRR